MPDSLTADHHRRPLVLVRCSAPGCRRATFFPVRLADGSLVCPTKHGGITPGRLAAHLASFFPPPGCRCATCRHMLEVS